MDNLWQVSPDFIQCPFESTHALPAMHMLHHILKVHASDPLHDAAQAWSRLPHHHLSQISITKRNRDDHLAAQRELPQPAAHDTASVITEASANLPSRLHVGYHVFVPESVLREYFGRYGQISKIFHTPLKKCYFVEMSSPKETELALERGLVRRTFQNQTFFVHPSLPPGTRYPGRGANASPDRTSDQADPRPPATAAAASHSSASATAERASRVPTAASSSQPAQHPNITNPPQKAASSHLMLHNVPVEMTDEDIVRALHRLGAPTPCFVTLIATPPGSKIRSVMIDFNAVPEATSALEALRNSYHKSHFLGQTITAQYV